MKLLARLALSFAILLPATSAHSQDWSGFYGGLSFANGGGDVTTDPGAAVFDIDGNSRGAFVGYNWQRGNLVYGGELAMSRAEIELVDFPTQEFTRFVDLKGRFGVATGRAMFYGTLGLVRSEFEISPDSSSGSGFSYGIGADIMVSDRIFVGAEFLRRDTRHDETAAILAFDAVIDTVSIRVGMAF